MKSIKHQWEQTDFCARNQQKSTESTVLCQGHKNGRYKLEKLEMIRNCQKPLGIIRNQWKSLKITENH
jgi:hypothetical protein